jgi:hypothetical protein
MFDFKKMKYFKNKIRLTSILVIFFVLVITFGYFLSDNFYAKRIITRNGLNNVDTIFNFIVSNKDIPPLGSKIYPGQSFKKFYSGNRKWLWCDEGAIAIAILANQIGYRTRLVDLIDLKDNISHHTIVEVSRNSKIEYYDFTNRKKLSNPCESVNYKSKPRFRSYPSFTQKYLLNNYFLREISELIWRLKSR